MSSYSPNPTAAAQPAVTVRRSRRRIGILALLAIGTMINYLDRTVLGIAAPKLTAELGIDPAIMGILFSAFAWTYALAQIPGGLFLDRFGNKVTYFLSLTLWSLFTLFHGMAVGLKTLLLCRFGLGISEAPCFPVNSRVVSAWFPQQERAKATAVYTVGEYLGLACFAPLLFWIMDGFGWTPDQTYGNAVAAANKPNLDKIFANYPMTTIQASGMAVGLPEGQMGNSEVGHTNIGGGRVVFQDLPRITRSIEDGTFFENPAYNKAMDDCIEKGSALHLYGLHSTGGVHSTLDHLYALLKMAHIKGLKRVYIHAFLDGRDTPPTSGRDFVAKTMEKCRELGVGKIATVMGRYYAMDRDKRWDRLENAYDALVYGEGVQDPDPIHAIEESYKNGVTDEFVEPIVCDKDGMISDNDSVIFFNYRPDRAREITRAFVDPAFDGFKREFFPLTYVCNTEYDATMPNVLVAFPRISVKNGLGEYLSKMGMTQLRIAETEKYAHVTFFFNGGVEDPYPGEDRVLVASPKVATYDLQPEMSAYEVASKCVERIESGKYDVIILNFANCDMVGHTGVFDAAVKAVETVDECVGQVVEATLKMGGIAMITADHGNAEQMLQADGKSPMTAHTTNVVPFILCGAGTELRPGRLADIAPTILDVMGLEQPAEMDGKTLIVR